MAKPPSRKKPIKNNLGRKKSPAPSHENDKDKKGDARHREPQRDRLGPHRTAGCRSAEVRRGGGTSPTQNNSDRALSLSERREASRPDERERG